MPNWQPNWSNVVWDWGAADAAVAALHRAAIQLEESATGRQSLAAPAQREWRGRYRDEFDVDLKRLTEDAQRIAAEYRATAGRIAAASAAASAEQTRREHERERWRREKQDEERREREARDRREREQRSRR